MRFNESSYFGKILIGTIEDHTPTGATVGECRVRIPELYGSADDTPTALLPVAIYYTSDFGCSSFGVLRNGRKVAVELLDGNPSLPRVLAALVDKETIQAHAPEFFSQYPNVYGFCDEGGNVFVVNKSTGAVRFATSGGVTVTVSGNVLNVVAGTVNMNGDTLNLTGNSLIKLSARMIKENSP